MRDTNRDLPPQYLVAAVRTSVAELASEFFNRRRVSTQLYYREVAPTETATRLTWPDVGVDQPVFFGEFGAATNMTRTHALAPVGERAVCNVPHGHWKTISTIAAMTTRGMIAAASFDGAIDIETFVTFVREELVPQLSAGQVVILDNLPAHESPRVDELIEGAGCRVLRLPPYSPDFNPIEMAISKVKRLLCSAARRTRSTKPCAR